MWLFSCGKIVLTCKYIIVLNFSEGGKRNYGREKIIEYKAGLKEAVMKKAKNLKG